MKKNTSRGVGRPMASINIPNKKFTFAELCEANEHVTPLTLRKFLKRDAERKSKSEVILVKDETRQPESKKGLGRKTFVYQRRAKGGKPAAKVVAKASRKARKVSPKQPVAPDYENTKAKLLGEKVSVPVSAPAPVETPITVPVAAETAPAPAMAVA